MRTPAFYFLLHEPMNHSKYSWRREYLKLSLGKRYRLEKVVEYEDKTIYRPTGLRFGLPFGCERSTKLDYTQALLRWRRDAAERKRLAEVEKLRKEQMQQGMDIARGFLPPRTTPAPLLVAEADPAALFDDFTIVDTEYQGEWLLELAAIRYKNWEPVGEPLVSYVRFTGWVAPAVTQLTGITEEHVRQAPEEKAVLQALLQFAGDSLLIAHNTGADRSKIEAARKRQGATAELPNKWFCTLQLARARLPKGTKCGLGELAERFGFSRRGHHQALADVQMCFQVLRHFQQENPLTSLDPKARQAAPTLFAA